MTRGFRSVRLEPSVSLIIDGHAVTQRQLEVLEAVATEGSQNRAAERLGISTPVLHRYLMALERKVGAKLVSSSGTGTRLTEKGRRVVKEFVALRRRMERGESVVVGCTPITQELLFSCLSRIRGGDGYDLIISDDERNLSDFKAGLMDLIIVDDPLYAFEYEAPIWQEVAEDQLIHVDRGSRYMRFKYGAQRIGFRHLQSQGIGFSVEGTTFSVGFLLKSNLSFFLNASLAARRGIELRSSTDPSLLRHKIIALLVEESAPLRRLLREMGSQNL